MDNPLAGINYRCQLIWVFYIFDFRRTAYKRKRKLLQEGRELVLPQTPNRLYDAKKKFLENADCFYDPKAFKPLDIRILVKFTDWENIAYLQLPKELADNLITLIFEFATTKCEEVKTIEECGMRLFNEFMYNRLMPREQIQKIIIDQGIQPDLTNTQRLDQGDKVNEMTQTVDPESFESFKSLPDAKALGMGKDPDDNKTSVALQSQPITSNSLESKKSQEEIAKQFHINFGLWVVGYLSAHKFEKVRDVLAKPFREFRFIFNSQPVEIRDLIKTTFRTIHMLNIYGELLLRIHAMIDAFDNFVSPKVTPNSKAQTNQVEKNTEDSNSQTTRVLSPKEIALIARLKTIIDKTRKVINPSLLEHGKLGKLNFDDKWTCFFDYSEFADEIFRTDSTFFNDFKMMPIKIPTIAERKGFWDRLMNN